MTGRVERWSPVGESRSRSARGLSRLPLPQIDIWLLLTTMALCGLGLIMVYSASEATAYTDYGNPAYFFERQLVYLVLGLIAMVICARMDYHRWRGFYPWLAGGTLVLLVAVLVPHIGVEVQGARRWIYLGPIDLQPSVMAQLLVVVGGAVWLERCGTKIRDFRDGVVAYSWRLALLAGLVLLEKDLGSTLVLAVVGMALLLIAGVRYRHLLAIGAGGLAMGALLIKAEPYRTARLLSYLNPFAHPLGTGFQAVQALYSIGVGGVFGRGLNGAVAPSELLPEAHTDFIFAIIAEDLGLIGTLMVLALFIVFGWRGIQAARNAPDRFGVLLAGGIVVWIVGQALINVGGVTDTIPSTGVPLTFISYGGSSLALSLAATGILLNISARHRRAGSANARADKRRRDGGSLHPGGGRGGGSLPD